MAAGSAPSRAAEFRAALANEPLMASGAMGTMLAPMLGGGGVFLRRSLDELNLSLPALVRDVHQNYARAGARILQANTFGANRIRLREFGIAEKARAINQAGVRIAREAARSAGATDESAQAFVAGVVGPLGVRLEPVGLTQKSEARAVFREQIAALVESGVDLLMLETFQDLDELNEAMLAARESTGEEMIVVAQVSVEDDGTLANGKAVHEFGMDRWPADIVGVNCSTGPRSVLLTLEQMSRWIAKPLSALPNAGLPVAMNGRSVYPCSPEYMAHYVHRFLRAGARIVGGCCGATPEHIRVMRAAMAEAPAPDAEVKLEPRSAATIEILDREDRSELTPTPAPRFSEFERGSLGAKLASKTFVSMVEIVPPRLPDASNELTVAKECQGRGIDGMSVSEGPPGSMSAITLCQLIQRQAAQTKPGMDCILHLRERGSNVAAVETILLDAQALGIRNVLCGGSAEGSLAAAVVASRLRIGLVGFEVNPFTDIEGELRRIEQLMNAGGAYAITRPVFDLDRFEEFRRKVEPLQLPLIAAIVPLTSYYDAEYFINEQWIPVPAASVARMSVAQLKGRTQGGEAAVPEGVEIARETIERLRGMAAGIQVSAPNGRYGIAIEVAESAQAQTQA